ncbi:hypothetical protein C8R44DRAFT_870034 [Mycena epipterygia]|nr:hypothetical protein C8R44DRAFT_870034 [Mycena epipterygia]
MAAPLLVDGILSGGAVAGLLDLLSAGDDSTPAARDLDARGGAGSAIGKLIGAGEESLGKIIGNAVIGGVTGGVAVEGVNTAAGQRRASIPPPPSATQPKPQRKVLAVLSEMDSPRVLAPLLEVELVQPSLAFSAYYRRPHRRGLSSIRDLVNRIKAPQVAAREPALGSVGKGLAGIVAGLGATQAAEAGIDEIKGLFGRDPALGSIGKGVAGLVTSLAATQAAEAGIDEIKSLFSREISFNDLDSS